MGQAIRHRLGLSEDRASRIDVSDRYDLAGQHWSPRGGLFMYAPRATVQHARRLSLREFIRLHYLYGGGTAAFRRACKRKGMKSVDLSSPSWYLHLLLYGMKREPGWRGVALSLLLAGSQAANLAGMIRGALERSFP